MRKTELARGVSVESRENYLHNLFEDSLYDDEALQKLSLVAAGRLDLPEARELLFKVEMIRSEEKNNA